MGLFDFLTREGRFKRHVRRMSDRDAPPEDREASAQLLFEDGRRFLQHGLTRAIELGMLHALQTLLQSPYVRCPVPFRPLNALARFLPLGPMEDCGWTSLPKTNPPPSRTTSSPQRYA